MTTRVLGRAGGRADGRGRRREEHAEVQWMSMLSSLSARQMFHRSTREPVNGPAVVPLPADGRAFPRSVAGCLARVGRAGATCPRGDEILPAVRGGRGRAER